MARSVRRRPYAASCGARSQKSYKQCGNRIMRRRNRQELLIHGDEAQFFIMDQVMSLWEMPQDGSRHYEPWEHYRKKHYRWWLEDMLRGPFWGVLLPVKPYDEAKERWSWFRWVKRK